MRVFPHLPVSFKGGGRVYRAHPPRRHILDGRSITISSMADQLVRTNGNLNFEIILASGANRMRAMIEVQPP
jgi:hypothetical protein